MSLRFEIWVLKVSAVQDWVIKRAGDAAPIKTVFQGDKTRRGWAECENAELTACDEDNMLLTGEAFAVKANNIVTKTMTFENMF